MNHRPVSLACLLGLSLLCGLINMTILFGQDSAPSSHMVFDDRFPGDIIINQVRVPKEGKARFTITRLSVGAERRLDTQEFRIILEDPISSFPFGTTLITRHRSVLFTTEQVPRPKVLAARGPGSSLGISSSAGRPRRGIRWSQDAGPLGSIRFSDFGYIPRKRNVGRIL